MDYTPDTPHHVPPSDDVRLAGERAAHRTRVARLKFRQYGFWYGVALLGLSITLVAMIKDTPWVLAWLANSFIILLVIARTHFANILYRSAYTSGMKMGIIEGRDAAAHAAYHAVHGPDEDCEGIAIHAYIPDVWEHRIVRDEIAERAPGVFTYVEEDDDDRPRS